MNTNLNSVSMLLLEKDEEEAEHFVKMLRDTRLQVSKLHIVNSIEAAAEVLSGSKPDIFFSCYIPAEQDNDVYMLKIKQCSYIIPLVTISASRGAPCKAEDLSFWAEEHLCRNELTAWVLEKTVLHCIKRRQNNQQFSENFERYQLLAKATNDIAWDWELSRNRALWTGNGLRIYLKYPHDEMLVDSRFWENNLHPEDKGRVMNRLDRILKQATENHWEDRYRFMSKEGEYRYMYDRGFIIYRDKKPVRLLGIMEDITAKIMMEEKLEAEKKMQQKQITEAVVTAQERERSEIGRELHDNVNQLLSASRLYIDAAATDTDKRPILLSQASGYIKNAIEAIRSLSKVLHTPLISELGLEESIDNLANEMMAVNDLIINLDLAGFKDELWNENFKLTLYRIVQEQLGNILKHARASTASITLYEVNDLILLEIVDDGVGFDVTAKRNGVGINNILSRANMYNGNVELHSEKGKGTKLTVGFPLKEIIAAIQLKSIPGYQSKKIN